MSDFKLDKSGGVEQPNAKHLMGRWVEWADLSPFVQGYVEAALTEASGMNFSHWGAPITFSMLATATLAVMLKDCSKALPYLTDRGAEGGRELWLRRQSGCWPQIISEGFLPVTLYLGDDGKVYQREQSA